MTQPSLSLKEKVGYGLGDTACNIVYQAMNNILLFFYTEIFGLGAGTAATMFLVVRVFDAVLDPVVGTMADRTRSKYGRYRPWLLWGAVPYGILAVLMFITPDFGPTGKLVYAYITYTLLWVAYTALNIPYSALGGVMVADSGERANLQTYRFAMAMVGGFLVTTAIFPLAKQLGGDNQQAGIPMAMAIMAVVAIVCFVGCFAWTRERLQPSANAPTTNPLADVKDMFANSQWLIIAVATLLIMTTGAMQSAAKSYYVKYYLINNLTGVFADIANLQGLFQGVPMLAGVAGALTAMVMVKKMCKTSVMKVAMIGEIVMNVLIWLLPRDQVLPAVALMMVANYFHMMFIPMLFSTIPDTVDFGLKTVGKGAMALFFAGHLFSLKVGSALGGSLTGWLLDVFGYQANTTQSDATLQGIMIAFAGSAIVGAVLVLICLRFYKLTKGWELKFA
ncbi:MAG TPA: MFS transporter [Candidatus Acidoferrum sp.]|nr:MFS transporter [Candidatus Acidoferrum sp.]